MVALEGKMTRDEFEDRAVTYGLQRHRFPVESKQEWIQVFRKEHDTVAGKRLEEIHGEEAKRVIRDEKPPSMRMNFEIRNKQRKKCRWLLMGNQEPVRNGERTDAPVAKSSSVKTLIAASDEFEDEVIALGDLAEAFTQADGFAPGEEHRYVKWRPWKGAPWRVYRLLGPLYGQREAPLRWYETLDGWLRNKTEGFKHAYNDICAYHNEKTGVRMVLHVDDVLVRGPRRKVEAFFARMEGRFKVKEWEILEPGSRSTFVGIDIGVHEAQNGAVKYHEVSQTADIEEVAAEWGITGIKNVTSPMPNKAEIYTKEQRLNVREHKEYRRIVGTLMWYATSTRWDIAHAASRLGAFLEAPTQGAMEAARRVLTYMTATSERKLVAVVKGAKETNVWDTFVDSNWGGDKGEKGLLTKSQTGMIVMLNGMPVLWKSNRQKDKDTAMSSAAAEIYALSEAVKATRLVGMVAEELGYKVEWPREVLEDNTAAISFQQATNPDSRQGGVIDYREDWVRDLQNKSVVKAVKVPTEKNMADMLTKCMKPAEFTRGVTMVEGRVKELVEGNYRWPEVPRGKHIKSYSVFQKVKDEQKEKIVMRTKTGLKARGGQ